MNNWEPLADSITSFFKTHGEPLTEKQELQINGLIVGFGLAADSIGVEKALENMARQLNKPVEVSA